MKIEERDTVGLENGRRGHEPKNATHAALEAGKGGRACSPRASGGNTALPTAWFGPSETLGGLLASRSGRK